MKKDNKVIGLLLVLLGVASLIIVTNQVYTPYQEKTLRIQNETKEYQAKVADLEQKAANAEFYEKEKQRMNEEMTELMNSLAVYYQPEDVVQMMCLMNPQVDMFVTSGLSVGENSLLFQTGQESNLPVYELYNQPATLQFYTSYQGLKDILYFLLSELKIKNVGAISIGSDTENARLVCSLKLDQYILTGTDTAYVDPLLPTVTFGTRHLFNSGGDANGVNHETPGVFPSVIENTENNKTENSDTETTESATSETKQNETE